MSFLRSEELFQRASELIPGGVNSPVRAFKGVDGTPLFFQTGHGAYLTDVDGHRYVDYIGSWGPMILGHSHPNVVAAINKALLRGISFGAPTELEILLAEKIIALMPSIEKIRMVNSGTEATMTAVRLARGYTRKNKIIKFNGCYHGHNDALLAKAGSGVLTLGLPSSPGIPDSVTEHTLLADYNDLNSVEKWFEQYPSDIAAIIIEPIAGNMGLVLPKVNFLKDLQEICRKFNTLLIFDEVMTGFRVALGGAQSLYDIHPDLTTLGKVIGGGMPVGAIGGRADIMNYLAPQGPVYQAGTLSGNPLAMAAGLATLVEVEKPGFYENLSARSGQLTQGLMICAKKYDIPLFAMAVSGMFGFYFSKQEQIWNYHDVSQCDETFFKYFYHQMLSRGVYFAPSMYEAGFLSSAHQEQEIAYTLSMVEDVFGSYRR